MENQIFQKDTFVEMRDQVVQTAAEQILSCWSEDFKEMNPQQVIQIIALTLNFVNSPNYLDSIKFINESFDSYLTDRGFFDECKKCHFNCCPKANNDEEEDDDEENDAEDHEENLNN
jgi:hypothetical protein